MKIYKIFSIPIFLIILNINPVLAQGFTGDEAGHELTSLIDMPTVGVYNRGDLGVTFDFQNYGILITQVELAIIKNVMLGFSYGGSNIIGTGNPDFYPIPGINTKIRLFTETRRLPSFSMGFNSQGNGLFVDSLDRYEIKSPGVFIAITKNFKLLGYFTMHGLFNFSFEKVDIEDNISFGLGFEKTLGPTISLVAEYDFAINDNSSTSLGDGKGYLNAGLRWSASKNLTLGLDFKNLLDNKKYFTKNSGERTLYIQYLTNLY